MPRPLRFVVPDVPHHITQRGNYGQKTFFRDEDRHLYMDLLTDYSKHYGVAIQAYCLMPNHVHLIATPHDRESLSRMLQRLHGDYAQALHLRLRRTGHLWQARFYSVPMDVDHFWQAMIYVEQNPVRAGLRKNPADWRWSSARGHLGAAGDGLLDLVGWRSHYSPDRWKRLLEHGLLDGLLLERIREATHHGWPLGSEEFLTSLEERLGRPVRKRPPGPRSGVEVSDPELRSAC